MCGIAGKLARPGKSHQVSPSMADSVLRSLHHRGPDMQGQYSDGPLWLGHLRLSILDLSSAGSQPMATPDDRYVICYNGETYNFAEIAQSLNLTDLRGHSDTEVILRAFAQVGPALFPQLNGMFAFSIYDRQSRKLWLVRDRLGIKPLFYALNEDGLFFASEIKALMAMSEKTPQCDSSSLHEWLYYGTTHGEKTLYRDFRQLLPGHFLEIDLSNFESKIERYWSPLQYAGLAKPNGSTTDRIQKTRELLEQAVCRQLISDVPVGIFLSGGVDSSAITAFASKHYK
ncbi:MAG: asparagine synthetase B family protein, partial [Pseudobdellovibrionaceae bacterium]